MAKLEVELDDRIPAEKVEKYKEYIKDREKWYLKGLEFKIPLSKLLRSKYKELVDIIVYKNFMDTSFKFIFKEYGELKEPLSFFKKLVNSDLIGEKIKFEFIELDEVYFYQIELRGNYTLEDFKKVFKE